MPRHGQHGSTGSAGHSRGLHCKLRSEGTCCLHSSLFPSPFLPLPFQFPVNTWLCWLGWSLCFSVVTRSMIASSRLLSCGLSIDPGRTIRLCSSLSSCIRNSCQHNTRTSITSVPNLITTSVFSPCSSLQCFHAVGWVTGRTLNL